MLPMLPQLTPIQAQAIDLLSSGSSVSNIAETLGIHRQTLWRWRQEADFAAAWDAERTKATEQLRDRFEHLVTAALNVIEKELVREPTLHARERQLPVAFALLRLLKPTQLLTHPMPHEALNSLTYPSSPLENPPTRI